MTRHDLMLACPVLPRKVRHTVRTDLGDCCAPMPSGALSARVDGLTCPAPMEWPWGLPRRHPTSKPSRSVDEGD
jgi:hypothetical protein